MLKNEEYILKLVKKQLISQRYLIYFIIMIVNQERR